MRLDPEPDAGAVARRWPRDPSARRRASPVPASICRQGGCVRRSAVRPSPELRLHTACSTRTARASRGSHRFTSRESNRADTIEGIRSLGDSITFGTGARRSWPRVTSPIAGSRNGKPRWILTPTLSCSCSARTTPVARRGTIGSAPPPSCPTLAADSRLTGASRRGRVSSSSAPVRSAPAQESASSPPPPTASRR